MAVSGLYRISAGIWRVTANLNLSLITSGLARTNKQAEMPVHLSSSCLGHNQNKLLPVITVAGVFACMHAHAHIKILHSFSLSLFFSPPISCPWLCEYEQACLTFSLLVSASGPRVSQLNCFSESRSQPSVFIFIKHHYTLRAAFGIQAARGCIQKTSADR